MLTRSSGTGRALGAEPAVRTRCTPCAPAVACGARSTDDGESAVAIETMATAIAPYKTNSLKQHKARVRRSKTVRRKVGGQGVRLPLRILKTILYNCYADEVRRFDLRALAIVAAVSRSRGFALVRNESISRCDTAVTSSTARLKASSFASDGFVSPEILRTNCSDAARISSSVAGGSKL